MALPPGPSLYFYLASPFVLWEKDIVSLPLEVMWCVSPFSFRAPRLACYLCYLPQTEEGHEQPSLCPGRPKQSAVGLRHPPIMVMGFRKAAGLFHHKEPVLVFSTHHCELTYLELPVVSQSSNSRPVVAK